jgi:uncharacterized protein YwqG
MKFFDLFRRKKEAPVQPQPSVVLPNGKTVSQRLANLLPKLEPVALPCVRIEATPSESLFLFDSKFGGHPYWPANKPYPVDGNGKYMYLLAQLNFAQIPPLEGYPEKGLLQFYLADDDLYGLDFNQPTAQTNFRVVYFENTDAPALENFHFLETQVQECALPVETSMQLRFTTDTDYYSFSDVRFPQDRFDELVPEEPPVKGQRSLYNEVEDVFDATGHKIGGYAYFTQDDPRNNEAYKDYILLLQIDSQGNEICWGDFGVGNFFIHPNDLKRKDFSKVLYNWDCT